MNNIFKRYEMKYLLDYETYLELQQEIQNYMTLDRYGVSTVLSLYYDTKSHLLIRKSMDKPKYKEKLRLRSYGLAENGKDVFLEIKKKYDGVVYKRRITVKEEDANCFIYGINLKEESQIGKEIAYFKQIYHDLRPSFLLIYDRIAYGSETDLRITFDQNIRYRTENLNLSTSLDGKKVLEDNQVLMEVKTSKGLPLWLARYLSEHHIFKTSFSKYAEAYKQTLQQEEKICLTSQIQYSQVQR